MLYGNGSGGRQRTEATRQRQRGYGPRAPLPTLSILPRTRRRTNECPPTPEDPPKRGADLPTHRKRDQPAEALLSTLLRMKDLLLESYRGCCGFAEALLNTLLRAKDLLLEGC